MIECLLWHWMLLRVVEQKLYSWIGVFSYNGGLLIGSDNFLPFAFIGMNSILLYVGHGILWRHLPFSWEMDKYGGHGEMLAMNITGTALWCLIAYYLFTKNVFLKV